ncbi:hypothetical protein M9H77_35327 [Catharanthus roseus]|uniref:Uncharacterized protein n=1 Tax=Catharanthus roseus TaxID=4058 RepID=A0ACB9ZSX9_CATRO|nr:hypothetical protein M9H77_35327 [Catharanthus roseus]
METGVTTGVGDNVEAKNGRRHAVKESREMVRLGARRGDDDLDPVTDRTGRVEGTPGSSTQPPLISCRTHPPSTSHRPYMPIPYDHYGSSQPPSTSYDPYAHIPTLPLRLQLGAQFFEQLMSSVSVELSYSAAEYEATDCGNPSSDARLGRDSSTSGDGDRTRSEEPDMPEGDGHDDDDGDSHGDKDEPIPVAPASSSNNLPAPGNGKGLTSSFMFSDEKKAKNDNWEHTGPADGGPLDQSLSLHTVGILLVVYDVDSDPAVVELAWETGLMTVTLHDVELILDVPAYSNVVDLHYSRDQFIAVIQSDLYITYSGGGQASQVDAKKLSGCCCETGKEVMQAIFLEVYNVGPQIGAQISQHLYLFSDYCRQGQSCWTVWVGSMYSSISYSPSGAPQASKQHAVQRTFTYTNVDMDQCPCCTTLSLQRQLRALVSLSYSSQDTESGKAPTWRSIAEYNSPFQGCSPGHDCS